MLPFHFLAVYKLPLYTRPPQCDKTKKRDCLSTSLLVKISHRILTDATTDTYLLLPIISFSYL
jgi:hypothetical protein